MLTNYWSFETEIKSAKNKTKTAKFRPWDQDCSLKDYVSGWKPSWITEDTITVAHLPKQLILKPARWRSWNKSFD